MRVAWLLVVACACEVPESPSRQHGDPPPEPTVTAPAAGVDCRLIAQTLTSLELGNYAEPEERGPRERAIEELCVRARLTRTDAECLLGATAVADLAACAKPLIVKHVAPPPLVPGDHCEQYVRALERIASCAKVPRETARSVRDQVRQLRAMYGQYGAQPQVQDSCKMALEMTEKAYRPIGC